MGTQGCAVFYTTVDGSPISIIAPATFNGAAIGVPSVTAPVSGVAGSGAISSLTITLNGNTGSGTVSLSNGDSGTISVGSKTTINIPTGTAAPSATFGPVVLNPIALTFSAPGQTQTVQATQAGNGSNTFTNTPINCPNLGSGNISQPGPGVFLIQSVTTSAGQSCSTTITGLGGFSATLRMTF
jgi:hypothetical protein